MLLGVLERFGELLHHAAEVLGPLGPVVLGALLELVERLAGFLALFFEAGDLGSQLRLGVAGEAAEFLLEPGDLLVATAQLVLHFD